MRFFVLLLAVALLLGFGGCAPAQGDYFSPFQGEFTARIEGEWHAVAFEAVLFASAPDGEGAREMTVTFYAPDSLSGTVLHRDAAGGITLGTQGLFLPLSGKAAQGYGALFALFPTAGAVQSITREGENTRLTGEGFSLLFAPDGTPLAAENTVARVEIKDWEMR